MPLMIKYPPWSRRHSYLRSLLCVWQYIDPTITGRRQRSTSRNTRRSMSSPSLVSVVRHADEHARRVRHRAQLRHVRHDGAIAVRLLQHRPLDADAAQRDAMGDAALPLHKDVRRLLDDVRERRRHKVVVRFELVAHDAKSMQFGSL